MSKRLAVPTAVRVLMQAAWPSAKVMGLDGEDAAPVAIADGGQIVVRSGDPGDPDYTLSPLAYHYEHRIPVEVAITRSGTQSAEERLDAMLMAIGEAVEADRTLGGLVDWLDVIAPETDDLTIYDERGALAGRPPRGAELTLIASYATTSPLA